MSRNIVISPGEYYHLYNRGVDKRVVFTREADYQRFHTLLYACNGTQPVDLDEQGKTIIELLERGFERGTPLIDICGYVLMPNHFHIYAREIREGGMSRFMQKLGNAYTGYFNKKYARNGSLFQGTYKARHVTSDPYGPYLISYIHLNPIKLIENKWKERGIRNLRRAEKFLHEYAYSSYIDYAGNIRPESLILNKSSLPSYCKSAGDFKKETASWLETENRKV